MRPVSGVTPEATPPSPARRALLCAAPALPWALAGGCTATAPPGAGTGSESRRLDTYVQSMFDDWWRLHPEAALAAGHYAVADRLSLPDTSSRDAERRFLQRQLQALQGFDLAALPPAQRLDVAVMQQRFASELWHLGTFKAWEWQPSRHNVAGTLARQLETAYAPLDERLRQLGARLAQVPDFYAGARAGLGQPTLEHTDLAIAQHRGALATVLGPRIEAAISASALAAGDQAQLRARAAGARAAAEGYLSHLVALRGRLAAGGARSFRIGKALYEPKFGHDIQSGGSADELLAKALAEKARLLGEMDRLARELWPKRVGAEPLPAARLQRIGRVIDVLSREHARPEDFVDTVRAQIPALARFVAERGLLDQDLAKPLVVREMPPHQRGTAAASIQPPGPLDPGAPTYYNVVPPTSLPPERAESFLREYNHWMLQLLNIHEAIPGHYTQLVHSNKAPSLVKTVFRNGAMTEGWAVYGERMMLEAGWGDHAPEIWLTWMKWNLRSVCNTILDHAVHTAGMSEQQATALLVDEAFQSRAEAADKWRRVTQTQVQLTSYFAGYSEIVALRDEQQARLGRAFDLRAFHNRFLSYGSVPVRLIREAMNDPAR